MKLLRVELCDETIAYLAPSHIVGVVQSLDEELNEEHTADPHNHTEVYYVGSDNPFYVREPIEQLQARWAELL